jgi:hypothetical protein
MPKDNFNTHRSFTSLDEFIIICTRYDRGRAVETVYIQNIGASYRCIICNERREITDNFAIPSNMVVIFDVYGYVNPEFVVEYRATSPCILLGRP